MSDETDVIDYVPQARVTETVHLARVEWARIVASTYPHAKPDDEIKTDIGAYAQALTDVLGRDAAERICSADTVNIVIDDEPITQRFD